MSLRVVNRCRERGYGGKWLRPGHHPLQRAIPLSGTPRLQILVTGYVSEGGLRGTDIPRARRRQRVEHPAIHRLHVGVKNSYLTNLDRTEPGIISESLNLNQRK